MNIIKKLFYLFTPKERSQSYLLLVLILLMALIDVLGIASIMPFIAVLANPQLVETNTLLKFLFNKSSSLGVKSIEDFLFGFGLLVMILLVMSLAFKSFTTYMQLRFSLLREYSLGTRLVKGYLSQDYAWFLNKNTSILGKTILSEVGLVVGGFLMPLLNLIAQTAVTFLIFILLVVVDPVLAVSITLVLGSIYGIIFKITSKFLKRIGLESTLANEKRFTAISEGFGGIKEVKVGGLEDVYASRFARPAEIYAKHQSTSQIVAQLPRFMLEAIAFGGMIAIILILMNRGEGIESTLPIIALYAFAGYRLMPALQQIYGSISQIRFAESALISLHDELSVLKLQSQSSIVCGPIAFKEMIEIKNIKFSYPVASSATLDQFSMKIPFGKTIGIVGSTGSGKTTAIDLIMGLLEPQNGSVIVDGQKIDSNNRQSWQKIIGYVPQNFYLIDDDITANIAFGVDPRNIDNDLVVNSAIAANIHEFIIKDLPHGYDTKIGERGVRLSGGQRQRIALARALYRRPQLLILDEATSALDNLTERAVMNAVYELNKRITVIIIAHRLGTVSSCDQIYLIDSGMIKAEGTFNELVSSEKNFFNQGGKI